MKRLAFFATKSDLAQLFSEFEAKVSVSYVEMGSFASGEWLQYSRFSELPNLGLASAPSSISPTSFLILKAGTRVKPRTVMVDDRKRMLIDQLENPESIEFSPGGMVGDKILLHGRFATVSDSQESVLLMKTASTCVKRRFTKIKAFYVGDEGLKLLQDGVRLTMSVNASPEYDLSID